MESAIEARSEVQSIEAEIQRTRVRPTTGSEAFEEAIVSVG